MNISVIICTANRSQRLVQTLKSIAASSLPESIEWEVLIVDNNSNDSTRDLAEDFCRHHPTQFRYIFESKPGKSHALNRGLLESRGDILVFTDDDVTVEVTWLRNLTANLGDERWTGAAGRTLPEQPFEMPAWILPQRPHALAPLAIFDPPLAAGSLKIPPYGNNMAFSRGVFERHGLFRIDLGPGLGPGIPQKSEDSEFGSRLLAAGEQLRYEPSAVLYHAVPSTRLQKPYFLKWWFDKARADVRAHGTFGPGRWFLAGISPRLLARLGRWTLSWLSSIEPRRRFAYKINVWIICGEIVESYRMSHAQTLPPPDNK